MLAKVNGLFRLTRDAEVRYSGSGSAIVKLGLVCSEKYQEKETTLFLDATMFGKMGEVVNQYAGKKGTQIYLSGKIQTEQWQDQQGQNRSKVSMIVEGFDFVSNKFQNEQQAQQQYNRNDHQQDVPNVNAQSMQLQNMAIPEYDLPDEQVPF